MNNSIFYQSSNESNILLVNHQTDVGVAGSFAFDILHFQPSKFGDGIQFDKHINWFGSTNHYWERYPPTQICLQSLKVVVFFFFHDATFYSGIWGSRSHQSYQSVHLRGNAWDPSDQRIRGTLVVGIVRFQPRWKLMKLEVLKRWYLTQMDYNFETVSESFEFAKTAKRYLWIPLELFSTALNISPVDQSTLISASSIISHFSGIFFLVPTKPTKLGFTFILGNHHFKHQYDLLILTFPDDGTYWHVPWTKKSKEGSIEITNKLSAKETRSERVKF